MKAINIWQLQGSLYIFQNQIGKEYTVVNTKTHKIVFSFKVIKSPEEIKFKIEKDIIFCK